MSNISTKAIEKALSTYTETVSSPPDVLVKILNQIPEKEIKLKGGKAIRSPYMWLAITEYVALVLLLVVVSPNTTPFYSTSYDEFSIIDKEIELYEARITAEDEQKILLYYTNLNNL